MIARFFHSSRRLFEKQLYLKWFWLWVAASLSISVLIGFGAFKPINHLFYDLVIPLKRVFVDRKIVILTIDEKTLKALGGWPLSRRYYAEFLNRLVETGNRPTSVGFDLVFADSDPDDPYLLTMLGYTNGYLSTHMLTKPDQESRTPAPVAINAPSRIAHINFGLGDDGFFRAARLYDAGIPHLALAMSGNADLYDKSSQALSRFSIIKKSSLFKTVSLIDALNSEYDLTLFKDAYVLVGATAESLSDRYPSSYSGKRQVDTPRVVFTASFLNAILHDKVITVAPVYVCSLINILAISIVLIVFWFASPTTEIAIAFAIIVLSLAGSALSIIFLNYWLDPTPILISIPLLKAIWSWVQMKTMLAFVQDKAVELGATISPDESSYSTLSKASDVLETAIRQNKNRFKNLQQVLNHLPNPTFALSYKNDVIFFNTAFEELFGIGEERPSLSTLLDRLGITAEKFETIVKSMSNTMPLSVMTKGTINKFIPHRSVILWNDVDRLSLITFVDVTSILSLQDQRQKTMQLLSHDMRTPLSGIVMLCDGVENSASELSANIKAHANRTLSMMDEFILAIKADDEHYVREICLFNDLLEQAMYEVKPLCIKANITLDIQQENLLYLSCDARLIERVLINLFNNAIRHSPNDSVIAISIAGPIPGDPPCLVYTVSNHVAPVRQVQPVNVEHKSYKLGLDFVNRVVTRHGGRIEKNIPESGDTATVMLYLPCESED